MIKLLQSHISRLLYYLAFVSGMFIVNAFTTNNLYAQVKFSAKCPEKTVGKNDFFQIQFIVENASDVEAITPPSFKNFSIVSGPNQQSGLSNINGKIDQYIAIGFYLKPKAPGKYTIGSAVAKVNGKEYYSDPVTVEVMNASSPHASGSGGNSLSPSLSPFGNLNFDFPADPAIHQFDDYILKKGENVNDKVQKNLFVKLEISKSSCFIGEPTVASYKLYTRLRSESVVTDAPSFNGFSVSDLEVNSNFVQVEKYNGRDYNVYTLRKVQLYPLQAGTITLDPVVTNNKVTFIRSDYAGSQKGDLFYDMLQDFANSTSPENSVIEERVILKSKPVQIVVKSLGENNKPADFKGAVGNFSISSSLEKKDISTDDADNVKIILRGEGNIQLINAPKINWPDGVDGYEANVTDDIDKFSVPMQGDKTFTYPFTVSKAGSYIIPSMSFSFFNPSSHTYKTLLTQPLKINVRKGKGNAQSTYVKKASATEKSPPPGALEKSVPYLIAGFALLAAFTLLAVRRKSFETRKKELLKTTSARLENSTAEDTSNEFIIPENPLAEAHEKLIKQNQLEFYEVLDASLKKYLAAKLKVPVEELTKKRMNEELDKCNVGLRTSLMLTSLLDEVELNVYAPPTNSNHLQNVYEKASEVVALLEKQVC